MTRSVYVLTFLYGTLIASRTMNPEMMAFVVAIAGMIFPAAAGVYRVGLVISVLGQH